MRESEPSPGRPLPESITRFLTAPTARIVELPDRRIIIRGAMPQRRNLAVRIGIAWAIFYNLAGAGILYWFWTTTGVSAP